MRMGAGPARGRAGLGRERLDREERRDRDEQKSQS